MILRNTTTISSGNNTVLIASMGFIQKGIVLLKRYTNAVGRKVIEGIPFSSSPKASQQQINEVVSNATEGFIKKALEKDSISPSANLLFMSASFFHGFWETGFDGKNTEKSKFHGVSGIQELDFINLHMPNLLWRNVPELNSEVSAVKIIPLPRL